MAVFFSCILLIGSGLVVLALFIMLAEKRRMHDYRKDLKEKKEDLIQVIEDADQLIEEMNRFSDYVVSTLEQKNASLQQTIAEADLRIECLNERVANSEMSLFDDQSFDLQIIDSPNDTSAEELEIKLVKPEAAKKSKVVSLEAKRREIINMTKNGLDSTEIAKLLNIGKGEIELITRMAGEDVCEAR